MNSERLVKIARALADPTRYRMLLEIRSGGELNCSQICERFDLSQPTISHHIKMLVESGLVHARKQGQFHVMRADERTLAQYAAALAPTPRARRAKVGTGKAATKARIKLRTTPRTRSPAAEGTETRRVTRRRD